MNGFVASRRPAGALLQAQGVIGPADEDGSTLNLLKVAFEAKVGIAHGQQPGIDAAMGGMTGGASFTQRLMFEYVRAALGRVACKTVITLGEQDGAATGKYASLVR
jgi:hypothetical protein